MTASATTDPQATIESAQLVDAPYWRLWLACVLGYGAIGMTLQVMPAYAQALGAGGVTAGFVVTVGSLATMVSRPIAGRFVDRRGARGIALIGAQLGVLGGLGHWLADSLTLLTVARLLLGAGEGVLFTAAIGWVLAQTAPQRRGQVAGQFGLSMWIGLAGGPVVGAALLAVADHRAVWLAASVLPALGWGLLLRTPQAPSPASTGSARGHQALLPRAAWRPGSANMLAGIGYGVVAAFLVPLFAVRFPAAQHLALAVFGCGFILTRVLASPWVDRLGAQRMLLVAFALEALGLGALALAGTMAQALAFAALTGAGLSLLYPCLARWVSDRAGPHERTAALGTLTSAWDLGLALGGPLGGIVLSHSVGAPFALGAVAAALATLPLLLRAR